MRGSGMSTHSHTSFQESEAISFLSRRLESRRTIKTFFSANDKTPNHDGFFELIDDDAAPQKQFIVQIKKVENLMPKTKGVHRGKYPFRLRTNFLAYVDARVSESPAIYFVVDAAQQRIFWLYLSAEVLAQLDFRGKQTVTYAFSEADILTDVDLFTETLRGIVSRRNAKLDIWDTNKTDEYPWQRHSSRKWTPDNHYTFDRYCACGANLPTVRILQAAADHPGRELHNPLYLHGPQGVGKTHLLHAAANRILQNDPGAKAALLPVEYFTDELVNAIRMGEQDSFRRFFLSLDVLLLDDLEFIAGKEATQIELFHCIRALCEHGRQVIFAGKVPLSRIPALDTHLTALFGRGISLHLQPPDFDTRVQLAGQLCRELGLELEPQVISYIASYSIENTRELEGILKKIMAYCMICDVPADAALVTQLIGELPPPSPVTAARIISQVCADYQVTDEAIRGKSRVRHVAEARQTAMYLIRKLTNLSLHAIGTEFSRDHTAVFSMLRAIEARLEGGDTALARRIEVLTQQLSARRP